MKLQAAPPYRGISLNGMITLVSCFLLLAEVRAGGTTKRTVWQWYTANLQTRPLITKSTTAAVVMSVSDLIFQKMQIKMQSDRGESNRVDLNLPAKAQPVDVHHRLNRTSSNRSGRSTQRLFSSRHDWYRTRDVAITGLTWSGPASHTWHAILEAVVTVKHRFWGVVVRLALDATIFSPIAVAGYFTWRTLLEGSGVDGVVEKLRARWKGALVASWRFWPAVNVLNFAFVPYHFRVLYTNCLSLFWSGYLSHVNARRLESVVDA